MLKIGDVIKIIEDFAPLENQADFDNSGLLYGDKTWIFKGALITLDTSVEVVKEAIKKGANLIIEHHPSIFYPLKKIDLSYPKHNAIAQAIKNDIAIYSAHTSVDFAKGGLNDYVMSLLGCNEYAPLCDNLSNMRIGALAEPLKLGALVKRVEEVFSDTHVAFVGDGNRIINKIAVINGGGGSSERAIIDAQRAGADVFMSGDFKYNTLRLAKDLDFPIVEFGHYDSEVPFMNLIKETLFNGGVANVYVATTCTNPLN